MPTVMTSIYMLVLLCSVFYRLCEYCRPPSLTHPDFWFCVFASLHQCALQLTTCALSHRFFSSTDWSFLPCYRQQSFWVGVHKMGSHLEAIEHPPGLGKPPLSLPHPYGMAGRKFSLPLLFTHPLGKDALALSHFSIFWRSRYQSLQSSRETNSPTRFLWTSEFWCTFECLCPFAGIYLPGKWDVHLKPLKILILC